MALPEESPYSPREALAGKDARQLARELLAMAQEVLAAALSDAEPLVRAHAAWSLGRIGTPAAAASLRARLEAADDATVHVELSLALERFAER